jgi:ABC-type glycerol-3-phosphate transport system permease component
MFHGDLAKMNQGYGEADESWMELSMPVEEWCMRDFKAEQSRKFSDYVKFKQKLDQRFLLAISVDGLYADSLKQRFGGLDAVNKALGLNPPAKSLADVRLSARVPDGQGASAWEAFVRKDCPVRFVRVAPEASADYRKFIRWKYVNIAAYDKAYAAKAPSFDALTVPEVAPARGVQLVDWVEFLADAVPIGYVQIISPEVLFRQHLARTYGTAERMNQALGTNYASFESVSPPYLESDWTEMKEHRGEIRHEFMVRNYREVLEYIALHGQSLLNTAILCFGIVLATLTVNPLCAFALSRYNLRSTYKILLFLLATMAFPAEVSAIPSFLLIKQLHLLGTYWAIILPSLASGYSVFLLKGFFDSLPKELYEAAMLDGATEMQMYRMITIRLSMPVLAVIGLGAFTMAYGSFMWAFLVCQNPKMWTLMVWLYQMQQWAPQYMVYAGLVLTAIPTLLVFIFCQNIIMRGIIIPSEK